MIAVAIATGVVAIANWHSRWKPNDRLELITKPLTTIGAIAIAAAADGPRSATILTVIALALCLVGDIALLAVVDRFVVGLAAFLLGHLAFMVMFVARGLHDRTWAGVAVIGVVALFAAVAVPILRGAAVKGFGTPVRAYLSVISVMCVLGWATGNGLVVVGATAFIISDSILGWDEFVAEAKWRHVAIMVSYHVAIVSLALSLAV
jgi:uncharacterized membrane protein YhhN